MKGLDSFLSRIRQDTSNKVLVESFLHLLDGTSIELRFKYYYQLIKILVTHDKDYALSIHKKILARHTGAQKKASSIADWVRKLQEIFTETTEVASEFGSEQTTILSRDDDENTVLLDQKAILEDRHENQAYKAQPARPLDLFVEKLNRANEGQKSSSDSDLKFFHSTNQRDLFKITDGILRLIHPNSANLPTELRPWQDIISSADFAWLQNTQKQSIDTYTTETHLQISAIFLQESYIDKAFALYVSLSGSKKHSFALCAATAGYLQERGLHYRVIKLWQGLKTMISDVNDAKLAYQSISHSWDALHLIGFRWSPGDGIEALQNQITRRLRPSINGILIGLK